MKKALILMNMGGADNLDEIKIFLNNMFNDKNIIKAPAPIRKMIAKFIIAKRENEARENYMKIGGKSPIKDLTIELVNKLQNRVGNDFFVTYSMRYTSPFAKDIINELRKKSIKDIILLPLYPQYSTTTTKSSIEEFLDLSKHYHFSTKIIKPFYKNKDYNMAIINQIKNSVSQYSDYDLIFSAHSLPQKIVDSGDPYQIETEEHIEILKNLLIKDGINFNSISLAYQSKLGPMKWIGPALDETLKNYKDKKVLIYPISFIVDNSETIFELDIEYRELASEVGLSEYIVIEALNSNNDFIEALNNIIKEDK